MEAKRLYIALYEDHKPTGRNVALYCNLNTNFHRMKGGSSRMPSPCARIESVALAELLAQEVTAMLPGAVVSLFIN
jgi:hypothetical protein